MSCTRNSRHIDNLAAEKLSSMWSMDLLLATNGHFNDFSAREDEKSKMDAKSGPDHVSFVYLKRCRSYLGTCRYWCSENENATIIKELSDRCEQRMQQILYCQIPVCSLNKQVVASLNLVSPSLVLWGH
jgi:hypothetical protein